uniref:Polyprotein n=1 Tax=Glossina morsitans morsitans TaxID=37546 RepID=D3TM19_GLOMM
MYIVGICAAFYGILDVCDTMHNIVDARHERRIQIRKQNELRAAFLKNHKITKDCEEGKCPCRTEGQLAYDQYRPTIIKKKVEIAPKTIAQMSAEVHTCLATAIRRNTFYIIASLGNGKEVVCRCIGLRNHNFIGLDHYFHRLSCLPLDTCIEFANTNIRQVINFKDISYKYVKNSGLVIGKLPIDIPLFKNIVKYFIDGKLVNNLPHKAFVVEPEPPNYNNKMNTCDLTWHVEDITLHDDGFNVPHVMAINDDLKPTFFQHYWSYKVNGRGMCGSLVISNAQLSNPIVGIHIAGMVSGERGYAELVTKETLVSLLDAVEIEDIEIEGQMFGDEYIKIENNFDKVKSNLEGTGNFLGVVPNKYAYNPPSKSKCKHSMCYNKITISTYDLPHLHNKDPRFEGSPMVKGCSYHLKPVKPFEQSLLKLAVNDVKELIFANVRPLRQRVCKLSITQSVCGIPKIEGYDAMEFDTSEGFPFSSVRPSGFNDKKWLFDLSVGADGYKLHSVDHRLMQVMKYKDNQRKQGIVPCTIFIDCLKDIKLPKEKCHKTRIFSVSPVDFTIQFRQLFYDFTIAFQKAMFSVESAVGINVDSYDWNDMVRKLLDNSDKFVCGDYSKFGPRLMTSCVLEAFNIISEWYYINGDTNINNRKCRLVMGHEIAFAKHLMFNLVYEVMSGAPSGCPITTILNNIVNMLYLRVAYIVLLRENLMIYKKLSNIEVTSLCSVSSFKNYICVIFYGDDLIMTVKEQIISFFNSVKLSIFFKRYDIDFTDALKTDSIGKDYATVYDRETSFLKRTIRKHDFRFVYTAAMDKRAIEETCNWVFEGHVEPEASLIACEAMMLNAFGCGRDYYCQLRSRVMEFWRKERLVPRIPTWDEVDWRIYDSNL